jgi:DNA polymerase-3 subunit gamma/tau
MGKALYRKYRSRSLDEVVGQDHITSLLKSALKQGRVSHAYLLTGPRGVGKTSIARILAHEINQLAYSDEPHLDIIEIDAASNRRIDDIRDLREKVHIAPVSGKYKVYIIDEVHMLTGESFNALLKTLEEPPEHVVFILATTEVHKVPATILSRTQRFHFRPVNTEKVVAHLKELATKEKIKIDDDALELIARHGGGSFRDSISLLDQLANTTDHITRAVVESVIGLVPQEQLDTLVDAIVHRKPGAVIEALESTADSDSVAVVLTDQLVESLASQAAKQPDLYQLIDRLLEVPRAHQPRMKLIALLAGYAHSHQSKTVAESTAPAKVFTSEPKPAAKKPVPTPATTQEPIKTAVPAQTAQPTAGSGTFDWEQIMTIMRKHHAPIASVLSRATIDFANNTLSINFPYTIHQKRMEQPASKQLLIRVINDVCGLQPTIVISSGILNNEDTASVAAIMGGGEPVNASI